MSMYIFPCVSPWLWESNLVHCRKYMSPQTAAPWETCFVVFSPSPASFYFVQIYRLYISVYACRGPCKCVPSQRIVILEYTNFRPNTLFPLPSSVKGFKTQKPLPSGHGAEHLRQESTITSINWLECSWETLLLPKPLKLWQFPQHILFIWVTRFLSVSELKCYYTFFFMF